MRNKGRHRNDPKPVFLVRDRCPAGINWTKVRPTSTSKVYTVKVRNIRFTDGSNIRFYETRPRRVTDSDRLAMKAAAKKKLKSIQQDNLKATKSKLRKIFRPKKAVR